MSDFVELRKVVTRIVKWWWLIILVTVVMAGIGYAVSQKQTRVYEATTTVMVGQFIQATELDRTDIQTSELLAQTYADLVRRQPVLQNVVDTLDLSDSWSVLRGRVSVDLKTGTQLLAISVEAHSPEEAREIADEVARQLILLSPTAMQTQEEIEDQQFMRQRIESLQAKIEAGQRRLLNLEEAMAEGISPQQMKQQQEEINALESLITEWENLHAQLIILAESRKSPNYLSIIEPAQGSSRPIRPQPLLYMSVAGALGLLLALGLILLLEFIDDTFKSADDLDRALNLAVLGMIGRIKGKDYEEKLIALQDPFSPAAEAYRIIQSNIEFMNIDQPIKSIVVTSPSSGEGKSITAANLGLIMAQAGLKTIIVDADLRRPMQHHIFQLPNSKGLGELLHSPELEIRNKLRNTKMENLQIITSGELPSNPVGLLRSQRMQQLLASLTELADMVIFDSPPVAMITDAAILSNRTDGVVLVIDSSQTRIALAKQAISNLQRANAKILGGIFNRVAGKEEGYYYRRYEQAYPEHELAGHPHQVKPRFRWWSSKKTKLESLR
jgi:non-specific protein-tyrosine kinase